MVKNGEQRQYENSFSMICIGEDLSNCKYISEFRYLSSGICSHSLETQNPRDNKEMYRVGKHKILYHLDFSLSPLTLFLLECQI